MPQMAPIWWTTLFMMFTLALIMMYITIYFNKNYSPKTKYNKEKKMNTMNWKW